MTYRATLDVVQLVTWTTCTDDVGTGRRTQLLEPLVQTMPALDVVQLPEPLVQTMPALDVVQ